MANETNNELANTLSNLMEVVGKLGQQQVDLVTNGIKSVAEALEPLCKAPAELAGSVFNSCNEVVQNVSAAITPKK